MNIGTFSEQDAKNAMELFKVLSTKAKFEFTVAESIKFAQLMQWYNTLPKRLSESAVEVKQVVDTEETSNKKSKSKRK